MSGDELKPENQAASALVHQKEVALRLGSNSDVEELVLKYGLPHQDQHGVEGYGLRRDEGRDPDRPGQFLGEKARQAPR